MSGFVVGYIFIVIFMVVIGIAAVIFVSFDQPSPPNTKSHDHRMIVRNINTQTIETVTRTGTIQRWHKADSKQEVGG